MRQKRLYLSALAVSISDHRHYYYRRPFITSLRKELRKDLLESVFVDQAARAFLLEAPVDELDLLSREPGSGREGGELLRLMSATKGYGTPGAP